ncbi:uncharacterized protein LOC112178075 [Rosa chinensis]|uniref:uncharacterized protein LOC112178075 n=1 Tax=Rosa chinensis TaxID=74649 RepID=UPI000D08F9A9|nr:uncharacterized protein LOC112178075 [Rosa chinensis]
MEDWCRADKSGGISRSTAAMDLFQMTMEDAGLSDMGFVGCRFTWSNKFTKERLDRGFQSTQWRDHYPLSRVITLPPSDSDHNPLLVEVKAESSPLRRCPRKFRFEEGNQLLQWHQVELKEQRAELKAVQEKLFDIMKKPFSSDQFEEQRLLHIKQSQLLSLQEKYWRQRSRALWLKEGDRNSVYFHRKASNRTSKNTIKGLMNAAGEWQTESAAIQHMILEYYEQVFRTETVNDDAISTIFRATPMKVTPYMNDELTFPYSDEEIKTALFQMHPSKSPGPDVNGEATKRVYPTRGIRQGDPLSPYLFILCAEGLFALISQAIQCGTIQGLKMCPQAPVLHHLFFADDSLLFGMATLHECRTVKGILNIYEQASRQKKDLAAVLNVKCVDEHDRYLGLPLRVGKSKIARFKYLKEKVSKKLIQWKSKILSSAGKEILIKAVTQVMPSYAMNCYLLPKSLCDDIHRLCASFFWGDREGKRKIHWRSWEKLCLTKHEGGMGFKNRSILESRPVLKAGSSWRIGDGTQVNIWTDQWIPNCPKYLLQQPVNTAFATVADLIDPYSRTWIHSAIHALFSPPVAASILSIPLSHHYVPDRWCWTPEKRGIFTVKSAYWIARQQVLGNVLASSSTGDPFQVLWKCIWKAKIPGKVQICAWRACNNLLPTREQLLKKGYDGDMRCLLCNHTLECNAHLFCRCPAALEILSGTSFFLPASSLPNLDFREWMLGKALNLKSEAFEKLLMIIWGLWKNRNKKLWEGRAQSSHDIMLECFAWLEEFQQARKLPAPRVQNAAPKWQPANILKLNVDGAFIPQASQGAIGGVLRSSNGSFVAAFMQHVQHVNSAKQVELLAIREGLHFLKQLGVQQVVMESDCLLAVQDIASTEVDLSDMSNLVHDIQQEVNDMQGVQITFAPRVCNAVAHRLASLAFEDGHRKFPARIDGKDASGEDYEEDTNRSVKVASPNGEDMARSGRSGSVQDSRGEDDLGSSDDSGGGLKSPQLWEWIGDWDGGCASFVVLGLFLDLGDELIGYSCTVVCDDQVAGDDDLNNYADNCAGEVA